MTNGGLLTTRSNRSLATGSSRFPARRSTGTSASAVVKRAKARARSERSVATTVPLCPARCRACTPQPVPRSRARPTGPARGPLGDGHRGRPDAEDVVRGQGATAGDLGLVRDDPPVVGLVAVGAQVAERSRVTGAELDETQRPGPDRGQAGQGAVEVGRGDGHTEREATRQDGDRVARPRGWPGRRPVAAPGGAPRPRPARGRRGLRRPCSRRRPDPRGGWPGPRRRRAAAGATRAAARLTVCRWRRRRAHPVSVGPAFGWCG